MPDPVSGPLMAPLTACAEGRMAPNMALMHLLADAPDEPSARLAFEEIRRDRRNDISCDERLAAVEALWRSSPELFSLLKMLTNLVGAGARSAADWAHIFDRAAAESPEASVALYSLGSTELLAQITDELVAQMVKWGLFAPDLAVLDLGCGTGRIARAVGPHVQSLVALDCSETMTRLARRKNADLGNVCVVRTEGDDLSFLGDARFDTVLAIDSFPYLVEAQTAGQHFADIARVLKAAGMLLIMNYSYRGDLRRDRADIAGFATQFGFQVVRNGTSDLTLWDGKAFLLRKA